MTTLTPKDLIGLVQSVFPRHPDDRFLGMLVDLPSDPGRDNLAWKERRLLAADWYETLKEHASDIPLEGVRLIAYADVASNNADLPDAGFVIEGRLPDHAGRLENSGQRRFFENIFQETQIFLAPTEFSTTAPLKVAAKHFGFRAATMPGFSSQMIPALQIDYAKVARRVDALKIRLDRAEWADVLFLVDRHGECKVLFDLRFRTAHSSAGRFPEQGTAGNLPSGEAYIVPYEGEQGESSRTHGELPVQVGQDIIFFSIVENRAVRVDGEGESVPAERIHLKREPAYGNMAELGFGVLSDFGLQPIGEILLDEKLGFHVAFGRSDHFGGMVGPKDFSSPQEVIHLDRIYIPATQPRIKIGSIILGYPDGGTETIMKAGQYQIF